MALRFKNMTGLSEVDRAIFKVETLLSLGSPMMKELLHKNDWQYGVENGAQVITRLTKRTGTKLKIKVYSDANTRAVGYYDGGDTIYINILNMPKNLVGWILHEYAHFRGFHHNSWIWFLNNFKTAHKCKFSVPYFLSENAWRWL